MNEYIFTFGYGQPHENSYTVIKAPSAETARKKMFRRFGDKWSMMYCSREEAGVEEFHLREIK